MKILKRLLVLIISIFVLAISSALFYSKVIRKIELSDQIPIIDKEREAVVLSAFFGLDELPLQAFLLHYKAYGKNGMPVVFSQELDPSTIDASDFKVITANGSAMDVEFVTLKPAQEAFELRTLLFIGEYGSHPENPPTEVQIIDDLYSRSGQNYKGQRIKVIPLPAGPTISYAEHFVIDEDYPYVEKGAGCDCPKERTTLVVRTVWAGGVKALNGQELGPKELKAFSVRLARETDTIVVHPFALADLGDNDNNIDLCLSELGLPIQVTAKANIAIDPRGDANPITRSKIYSRW